MLWSALAAAWVGRGAANPAPRGAGRHDQTGVDMSQSERPDFEQRVKTWRTFTRLIIAAAIGAAVVLVGLAVAFT
jgi:hypothetical protein